MKQVPSTAQMLADIETILGFGIRRPGYPADHQAEEWAAGRFADIGLTDVVMEPVELPSWESSAAVMDAWTANRPSDAHHFSGFALPYTGSCAGLERDLVAFDPAVSRDQIVVEPLTLIDLPAAALRDAATFTFDPDDFGDLIQTLPFGPGFNSVPDAAIAAGAAGYVGILTGVSWQTHDYYVPYDAKPRPIPALWLNGTDGHCLQQLLASGRCRARLQVDSTRTMVTSHNVVGRLPGPGDEVVIIGSHHDAPWASAVEDASGMALVLAQAAYWASVPAAERPHGFVFVLTAGHMAGGAGARAFTQQHADLLDRVVLEVHLEHAAAEVRGNGVSLELTGQPEPRWWFTSGEPGLQAAVASALQAGTCAGHWSCRPRCSARRRRPTVLPSTWPGCRSFSP
jgi:Peptidase family M28